MQMAADYQLEPTLPGSPQIVRRLSDQAFIPSDPANRDFVAYQAWCEAGNQADPAQPTQQPA
jgi:hypothetical protein